MLFHIGHLFRCVLLRRDISIFLCILLTVILLRPLIEDVSNFHTGHPHELQLALLDGETRKRPVNVADCQVKSLAHHLKMDRYVDQPVHKDGPHAFRNVGLNSHVVGVRPQLLCHLKLSKELSV